MFYWRHKVKKIIVLFLITFNTNIIYSKGDLTRQNPQEVKINFVGESGNNHFFSPSEIELETGILYKLILTNLSSSKHYFTSLEFSDSVFTRKVQVVDDRNKIAEIKGHIKEIEVFPGFSVEWWLIPIKTGVFDDLHCRVLDKITGLEHRDMGMRGKIVVK